MITESTDFASLTPYNLFFAVFPYDSLGEIAHLTNIYLLQEKCAHISVGKPLTFIYYLRGVLQEPFFTGGFMLYSNSRHPENDGKARF
jgi:hypothetical protein